MEHSRVYHLDIMKCAALCIMPFLHEYSMLVLEELCAAPFPPVWLSEALGWLYNFVPTVFMFCLGCGVVLTRHAQPKELARRGSSLILIGLVLNLVRFVPYYLAKGLYFSDPAALEQAWLWLIGSDILPFAGLSFLFFAEARKRELSEWAVLAFGLACAVGQSLLPVPQMSGTSGALLANLIFINGGDGYFPFFSWILFPCLGYFYQIRLRKTEHPARLHLLLGAACAALLPVSIALLKRRGKWKKRCLLWGVTDLDAGFRMEWPLMWITSLLGGIWLSVSYFLSSFLERRPLRALAAEFSRRMNSFYCIHWTVLMGCLLIAKLRGKRRMRSPGTFLAAGTALLAAGVLLTKLWTVFRASRRS